MKAGRNKTIDLSVEEGNEYLKKCLMPDKKAELPDVLDKTILGDTFEVLRLLPKESVDLLIVDPPYNLDKDFHGNKFKKTSDEAYLEYTEKWIKLVKPLLKANATIYVCCDWISSSPIFMVLKENFHVQNRITWQREKGRGALSNWKNGMEDIWFVTNSAKYTFNVEAVKMRHIRWTGSQRTGRKRSQVTLETPIRLIFGMIFPSLIGLCLRIPPTLPKSLRSS